MNICSIVEVGEVQRMVFRLDSRDAKECKYVFLQMNVTHKILFYVLRSSVNIFISQSLVYVSFMSALFSISFSNED